MADAAAARKRWGVGRSVLSHAGQTVARTAQLSAERYGVATAIARRTVL